MGHKLFRRLWNAWRPVFARLSAQVNAVQIIVLTALQFVPLPMQLVLPILLVLAIAALGAARVKQKNVRTYNPKTHYLVEIDRDGDVNE